MYQQPNEAGFYGEFGGKFVPETLMYAVQELEETYEASKQDEVFQRELAYYLKQYVGRENPLYLAERLTNEPGGAPAPASMGWQLPPPQPFSGWNVSSLWGKSM